MDRNWLPSLALAVACLVSCDAGPPEEAPRTPGEQFFDSVRELCGQAFLGSVVSDDPADADFARAEMVMHVRDCDLDTLRIPFHVGEDRSRTWILSKTGEGLRLKHDHRHEDGTEDEVTQYGGDTASQGSASRQEFPADDVSKAMFQLEDLAASVDNVWAMEIDPQTFAYELRRPNRHFRVEFDLTNPVEVPAPAWGISP